MNEEIVKSFFLFLFTLNYCATRGVRKKYLNDKFFTTKGRRVQRDAHKRKRKEK